MRVAIASGKGGTGKTILATNLAALLAEKEEVVLADLDVEAPNSGLFINGKWVKEEPKYKMIPEWKENTCELCGQCQKVCNFNAIIQLGKQIMVFPELCHSCNACTGLCPTSSLPVKGLEIGKIRHFQNGKITFIEGHLHVGQEQSVPLISQTIKYVNEHFGDRHVILFDSPPGTSCPVIEATKNADYVILVTEPTPFGMHDLMLTIDTMKQLNREFGVVINRNGIGNNDVADYCKKEHFPVLAVIPNKRSIAELYSRGRLIYMKDPEVRTELEKIIRYIFSLKTKDEA